MRKKYSSNKDIHKLVCSLIKKGWSYQRRTKHGSIRSPNGFKTTVPGSPSDRRAYRNFLKDTQRQVGK